MLDRPRPGVVVASLGKEWGKVLMVIMGVMLANKVPCMDSMMVIHDGYSYYPNWVPPSPTPLLSIE